MQRRVQLESLQIVNQATNGATLAETEEEQLYQTGSICCPLVHAISTVVGNLGNVSIPLLQVLLNCVSFLLMLVPSSWMSSCNV